MRQMSHPFFYVPLKYIKYTENFFYVLPKYIKYTEN